MVTVVALRNATIIWVLLDVSRIKKCAGLAGGRARPVTCPGRPACVLLGLGYVSSGHLIMFSWCIAFLVYCVVGSVSFVKGVRGDVYLELVLVHRIEKCVRPAGRRVCGRACLWLGGPRF